MTSKEDLKMIKIKCHPNANPNPMIDEALNNVEKDLERLEKQDKILDIIKKKDVDFYTLIDSETLDDYNSQMNRSYRKLTKEEHSLLKEWLDA